MITDAFAHHPELRGLIADPSQNFFRQSTLATLAGVMDDHGLAKDWWYSDAEREAKRETYIAPYRGADLWVFAYGSLMWDPGFYFTEVRRAHLPGHMRKFILRDIYGGRGRPEAPGLMAALDVEPGVGCDGLAFRITPEALEEETRQIWKREFIAPGYHPVMPNGVIDGQPVPMLTFVADYSAELIVPDLTRAEQVHYLRNGSGFLGTSLEYLQNIARQFRALGIKDAEVDALLWAVEAEQSA